MAETTTTKATGSKAKRERVQLVKRWNGHLVGETFDQADAERLGIPAESLQPFEADQMAG